MKTDRIKAKEFSRITSYTERNLFYIRKRDPESLGYDQPTATYSKKKAHSIANILNKYTPQGAAYLLHMTEASVRYHVRQLKLGKKLNNHIYLTLEEIRIIDITPNKRRGPKVRKKGHHENQSKQRHPNRV
jgi:hypothetical protein